MKIHVYHLMYACQHIYSYTYVKMIVDMHIPFGAITSIYKSYHQNHYLNLTGQQENKRQLSGNFLL